MSNAAEARAKAVFDAAFELPAGEREAYLARACGADAALRRRVEVLLAGAERDDSFLAMPTGDSAPAGPAMIAEAPGQRIGPYHLLKVLGEGGFGVVFQAEQERPLKRQVALKIIKRGMDSRAVVGRFEQERQALALMDHPNIARVFDAGQTPAGRPYFVMELVQGKPITAFCDAQRLSIPERIELFTQVCAAVQHAHTKGVIHRDIKPGNVLVSLHDGKPVAKVIDFGIAKATQRGLAEKTAFTEDRQLIGTPEYMSPEQAAGSRDIDTRSDVYSLGVLLYELLSGLSPFDPERLRSAAFAEVLRIIAQDDPPAPSTRLSRSAQDVPAIAARRRVEPQRLGSLMRGDLDWVIMRALEKDRARRYASPGDLAEDLRRFLTGLPVVAAPPSAAYRARKFVSRHRVPVIAGAAVVLALVLGMAGTAWGMIRAQQQRDRAVVAEAQEKRQRTAAQDSESKAKLEAARSAAVAGFLTDMLRGVGPAHAQGRDTAVLREILDATVERLDKGEFKDNPAIEADLRHVIGVIFSDLGMTQRSIAMHREALRLRIAATGPESADTTLSLNDLGKALWEADEHEEAEALFRRVLDIRLRTLGPDHADVATAMNNLAMLMRERGDFAGAEGTLKTALQIRRRTAGEESPEVSTVLGNLALIAYEQERYAQAEEYGRRATQIELKVYGRRHPSPPFAMTALAMTLEELGKWSEAESLLREALAIRRAVLPGEHPSLGLSAENLAGCLQFRAEAGDPSAKVLCEEAVGLYEEAEAIERKASPKATMVLARILFGAGRVRALLGRYAEGERAARESLEIRRRLIPDDSAGAWRIATAEVLLGRCMGGQGRFTDAEPLCTAGAERLLERAAAGGRDDVKRAREGVARTVELYEAWEKASPGAGAGAKAAAWRARMPAGVP